MKNNYLFITGLLIFTLLFAKSQTNNPFSFLSEAGPAFKMSGGMSACLMPARKNIITSNSSYSKPSEFTNYSNFAFCSELTLQVSPLNSPYLSYFFKFNGNLGWLGNAAQSGYYYGHEIKVGAKKIKLVVEPGTVKLRKASFYQESIGITSSSETISITEYKNTFRISVGANFILKNNSELEFRYINEQYNFESRTSNGIFLSFLNKKSVMFFGEFIFNHPVTGYYYLAIPQPKKLDKEGMYLRIGITANFFRGTSYKKLAKG